MESFEPDLRYLLSPAGEARQIGPETQVGRPEDGSVKFLSPHGSYRYVRYIEGKPVAALQIMSKDGRRGTIANVYTLPEYRRKGIARELLERARRGFESLSHSRDLSTLGALWKGGVENTGLDEMKIHKTTLRCGETMHVLVAGTEEELRRMEIEKKAKLLRANGDKVTDADGRSVWIVDEEEHPTVWHKDGNRVRARRVRYEQDKDGSITKSTLKTVWKSAID